MFLFIESKNKSTQVQIPYFYSWEFDILQAAGNVSGPAAPDQGRGATASFTLYLIPEQGKLSTCSGISAQSQSAVLSIRAAIHTFQGLWFLTEADRRCLRDQNKQPNSDTCFDTSLICVIRLTDEDHLHIFSIYLLMLHTVYISPISAIKICLPLCRL